MLADDMTLQKKKPLKTSKKLFELINSTKLQNKKLMCKEIRKAILVLVIKNKQNKINSRNTFHVRGQRVLQGKW